MEVVHHGDLWKGGAGYFRPNGYHYVLDFWCIRDGISFSASDRYEWEYCKCGLAEFWRNSSISVDVGTPKCCNQKSLSTKGHRWKYLGDHAKKHHKCDRYEFPMKIFERYRFIMMPCWATPYGIKRMLMGTLVRENLSG